jgi:hypothetical protein
LSAANDAALVMAKAVTAKIAVEKSVFEKSVLSSVFADILASPNRIIRFCPPSK